MQVSDKSFLLHHQVEANNMDEAKGSQVHESTKLVDAKEVSLRRVVADEAETKAKVMEDLFCKICRWKSTTLPS
jgi:hypothetical protein